VRERKAGHTVRLTILRGGETVEVDAVLRSRPAD